jgi:autotransporter-associated beta strand protein
VNNGSWIVNGTVEVGPTVLTSIGRGRLFIRNSGEVIVTGDLNIHGSSTSVSDVTVESGGRLEVGGDVNVSQFGKVAYQGANPVLNSTFNNFGTTQNNGQGGRTQLESGASASNATFTNHGSNWINGRGITSLHGNGSGGNGTFNNLGGTAHLNEGGATQFYDNATAGSGTYINHATTIGFGGTTRFYGNSTGGSGNFFHRSGPNTGRTEFHENSTAGNGTFVIEAGGPGAGGASILFDDDSDAGDAQFTIQVNAYNAIIAFEENASAQTADFDLVDNSSGRVSFGGDSDAGTASFDIGANGILQFITRSSAEDATIVARQNSVVSLGGEFNAAGNPTVTAGTAEITVEGSSLPGGGSGRWGGHVGFSTWSTAGNSVINVHGGTVSGAAGGTAAFDYSGSAGNATLITHGGVAGAAGGQVFFRRGGNGPNAKIINNAGGYADFGGNIFNGGTDVGSIEGAGTFALNGSELRTGSLNTNTIVTGPIIDAPGTNPNGKLTKVGTGHLTLAGTNTYTGLTTVNGGRVSANGSIAGGAIVNNSGTLDGTGIIAGAVTVNAGGVFAPGTSPGTITVGGLQMAPDSALEYELGTQRDRIVVTNNGNIALDGTLDVALLNGFEPALNQSFALFEGAVGSITGTFDAINLPIFNGRTFDVVYNSTSVLLQVVDFVPVPGDYNQNGIVDAADYTVWRDTRGSTTNLAADGSGNGTIDTADYNFWRARAGNIVGRGNSSPVPEPASALGVAIGVVVAWRASLVRRRKCNYA